MARIKSAVGRWVVLGPSRTQKSFFLSSSQGLGTHLISKCLVMVSSLGFSVASGSVDSPVHLFCLQQGPHQCSFTFGALALVAVLVKPLEQDGGTYETYQLVK